MSAEAPQMPLQPVCVAFWGTGAVYRAHRETIARMRERGDLVQPVLLDSNPRSAFLDDMPVLRPGDVRTDEFDFVVVLNKRQSREILEQAVAQCGFSRDVLLTHEILAIPGFDFPRYRALRAVRPSVFSNSSWGTAACRALQMDSRSPLRGVRMRERDYLAFLESLDDYLAVREPQFLGWRTDAHARRYLAARVGDVSVRFHDADTPEAAWHSWREGCAAVNRQAVVAQMHTLDPAVERRFSQLDGVWRAFCFVPYQTDIATSVQVPIPPGWNVYSLYLESMFDGNRDMMPRDSLGLFLGEMQFGRPERHGRAK